jgi:hypothetical protein
MARAAQISLALLVAAAGATHLYLYFDYFHRVHVIGVLFPVNAAAGIAIGAILLARRDRLVLFSAFGYAVGRSPASWSAPAGGCSATTRPSGGAGRRPPAESSSRLPASPRSCSP